MINDKIDLTKFKKSLLGLAKNYGPAFEVGAKAAGLYIQAESQKIVPVDTGVLHNSSFTRAEPENGGGLNTVVSVGYTAEYAIYVHEDLTARHQPGKTAKYLERIYLEKKDDIRRVFRAAFLRKAKKST